MKNQDSGPLIFPTLKWSFLALVITLLLAGCMDQNSLSLLNPQEESLTNCGAGQYLVESTCIDVGKGYYSPVNNNNRTACASGMYSDIVNAASCIACTNKPDNASLVTYTAATGTQSNNCAYATITCVSGYTQSGNTCTISGPSLLPITSFANQETRELLTYLYELPKRPDKKILSGQASGANGAPDSAREMYELDVVKLKEMTGYRPTIIEYACYYNSHAKRRFTPAEEADMREQIITSDTEGHLMYIRFWPQHPRGLSHHDGALPGYQLTNAEIQQIINQPESDIGRQYRSDLEKCASNIRILGEAGIPVMLEIFNEFNGNWNWFGTINPETFKQFYRFTVNQFRNQHRLNNALYVLEYSAKTTLREGIPLEDYWPGNNYVDIAGFDFYEDNPGNTFVGLYNTLKSYGKPVAMTEYGPNNRKFKEDNNIPNDDRESVYYRQDWSNLVHLEFTKNYYPDISFFIRWNNDWAIAQQRDAVEFMNDPIWRHLEHHTNASLGCGAGKYLSGGICINVGRGYYSPANNDNRTACASGMYSDIVNAASCSACTNRPDNASSVTYTAATGTQSNNCAYATITCMSGYTQSGNTCVLSRTACGAGQYLSGGSCINVGRGYYSPANNDNRTACAGGMYSAIVNAASCSACTNRPDNASSVTYTAATGTQSNNCAYATITCMSGYTQSGNTCVLSRTACGAGQYLSGGSCINVGRGYYSPANNDNRTACAGGMYSAIVNAASCSACTNRPDNASSVTYTAETGTQSNNCAYATITCVSGYTQSGNTCVLSRTACGAGQYLSGGSCINVGRGYYSPANNDNRTACAGGMYSAIVNAASCSACTNRPDNASSVTYTAATGTQSNNCAYATITCMSGYTQNGNTCVLSRTATPGSGIFAIWYGGTDVFTLPMVLGGQVVVQWSDVEKSKNNYDFSVITTKIAELKTMGKLATIQINGNNKPAYLFNEVPWVAEKFSSQIQDTKGSLMYWHPNHINAHKNLLKALGRYLSSRKSDFIGIRMNYNAFGTEHTHLADLTYRDASRWNYPSGVEAGTNWTTQVGAAYQRDIHETYVNEITPHLKVFVRNGIDTNAEPELDQYFSEGTLSLFHTSSESEPRSSGTERRYQNFYTYCRSGKTTCYAEPWASSMGHHGSATDDRVESMPQWLYWRLLIDLHSGVSHIAVYGTDLRVALNGKYSYGGNTLHDDAIKGTNYKKEFNDALLFASKYAGYHASAHVSPGAWVAFRGNDVVRNANDIPEEQRRLNIFNGDYDFLMKRLPDNSIAVEFIGSRDTRFGSWARKLPKDEKMILEPDPAFIASLTRAELKVIWFDAASSTGRIRLRVGENTFVISPSGSGTWKESKFSLSNMNFTRIEIEAVNADVIMHMVEITR